MMYGAGWRGAGEYARATILCPRMLPYLLRLLRLPLHLTVLLIYL
jgi:hypothetical protein